MSNVTRLEIEYRYLLSAMPDFSHCENPLNVNVIEQGYYIDDKNNLVRLRKSIWMVDNNHHPNTVYHQTVKQGSSGNVRREIETVVTENDYLNLWPLTKGRRLTKNRYHYPYADLIWEIDKFTSIELILAEVEVETIDHIPVIPPIIQQVLIREVTEEPEYLNCNLAH